MRGSGGPWSRSLFSGSYLAFSIPVLLDAGLDLRPGAESGRAGVRPERAMSFWRTMLATSGDVSFMGAFLPQRIQPQFACPMGDVAGVEPGRREVAHITQLPCSDRESQAQKQHCGDSLRRQRRHSYQPRATALGSWPPKPSEALKARLISCGHAPDRTLRFNPKQTFRRIPRGPADCGTRPGRCV